jgi:hypothetical protein
MTKKRGLCIVSGIFVLASLLLAQLHSPYSMFLTVLCGLDMLHRASQTGGSSHGCWIAPAATRRHRSRRRQNMGLNSSEDPRVRFAIERTLLAWYIIIETHSGIFHSARAAKAIRPSALLELYWCHCRK